jgi:hypothetical protein
MEVSGLFYASAALPPRRKTPGIFSSRVKQQGLEDDYSSPSSSEVRNTWSYASTSPYFFVAW